MRLIVSSGRRRNGLTAVVRVARAAAPDGGYLATAERYVYRGRRSHHGPFPLRVGTRVMAITGAMLTATVLGALLLAVNFTVRPTDPLAEPVGVPDYAYPPPDTEPTLPPASPSDPPTGDAGPVGPGTPGDGTSDGTQGGGTAGGDSPETGGPDAGTNDPGPAGPGAPVQPSRTPTTKNPTTAPSRTAPAAAGGRPVSPTPTAGRQPAAARQTPRNQDTTRSYEAEAAFLYGVTVSGAPKASGGKVVRVTEPRNRNRRQASNGAVHFTRVSAPRSGRYAVSVFYLSADSRNVVMLVNGRQQKGVRCSGGGSDTVRSATVTVDLVAGHNSITLGIPSHRAPRLDRITVYG